MRKLFSVIMALFVINTAAQADTFQISSHGDWKVQLYMGENNNTSCDIYTSVDDVKLAVEFWNDQEVHLVLYRYSNEIEPVPSDITLTFNIDQASPFTFRRASNYGGYIRFAHDASNAIWGNLLKEMSSGQRLYFLDKNNKRLTPSFSLRGTSQAIADWKQCIKRLGQV